MSKVISPKQQVVAKFRQSEILAAARSVFARKGFEAALVDDIAAEAGIAKGTVYLYFKSKAEIYSAALQEDLEELAAIKRERVARAGGLREKLLALFVATIEFCDERRDFFRIYLLETGKPACSPLHAKEIAAHKASQFRIVVDLLAECARNGEIRPLPAERAATLIGDAIRGTIERRLLETKNSPAQEDAQVLVDLLWNGFKPETGAKRGR